MPEKPRQAPAFFYPASQADDAWLPSMDIYRTRWGWLLKFDLAGVRLEDVSVDVQGCHITVSGMRRDSVVEEGCSYHSMEISYNRFRRTVELPCDLENPRITLEGRNGILLIRVLTEPENIGQSRGR